MGERDQALEIGHRAERRIHLVAIDRVEAVKAVAAEGGGEHLDRAEARGLQVVERARDRRFVERELAAALLLGPDAHDRRRRFPPPGRQRAVGHGRGPRRTPRVCRGHDTAQQSKPDHAGDHRIPHLPELPQPNRRGKAAPGMSGSIRSRARVG